MAAALIRQLQQAASVYEASMFGRRTAGGGSCPEGDASSEEDRRWGGPDHADMVSTDVRLRALTLHRDCPNDSWSWLGDRTQCDIIAREAQMLFLEPALLVTQGGGGGGGGGERPCGQHRSSGGTKCMCNFAASQPCAGWSTSLTETTNSDVTSHTANGAGPFSCGNTGTWLVGVRRVALGYRRVVLGCWRVVLGCWRVELGCRRVELFYWRVVLGCWRVERVELDYRRVVLGYRRVVLGCWRVEVGYRRVVLGCWRVEVGCWRVVLGCWRVVSLVERIPDA
ncbi:hypothetical protein N1851_002704 [Merluccius polli]|uniref:Uncharacterized protein n=1 Tax=Merluccius polli TaxID=89951 RepID=A0AA47NAR8_MERPO|nr:hypothetical protein N1851_002704 [Merluccius polli]